MHKIVLFIIIIDDFENQLQFKRKVIGLAQAYTDENSMVQIKICKREIGKVLNWDE